MPRSFTISSNEILEALTDPLNQMVSAVKNALEQTPPELGADIAERGMMLTGGGALLRDLDRLLAEETGLPVLVAEDPLTCVVRGCGMALERMERLGSHLHLRVTALSRARLALDARAAMSLGTIDRTPPPFFRQGPSALTKLVFFSALALFLMVADTRFAFAQPLRAALATVLLPVQRACCVPVQMWQGGGDYLRGLSARWPAKTRRARELARQAETAAAPSNWRSENARLRALLDLRPALHVRSLAGRGAVRGRRPVLAQGVHRPRRDPGRGAGRAGDQPGRRARPGDAGLPAESRR